ncbi:MAG TPA: molybdenum cofactor guanylyltransferase MobA [Rudaea sp.]|jgi:molybdopterin-guanine dinucleotide biosynthesis protein A|nr:molybdenum cofactor guanylyltransferase MobA [Rudaea sp.]
MNARNVTAAILAGGAGRRLGGRDKGLENLAGRALIAHVIERIRPQVGAVTIVANRNREVYANYATVIADDAPGFLGPLAGIASALACCTSTWLLTASVDVPRPPLDLVARLMSAIGDSAVAVAHDGERRQPLFALYSTQLAGSANDALERDLAVWRWQDENNAVDVDFSHERDAFRNLNAPDDFRNWENAHHG